MMRPEYSNEPEPQTPEVHEDQRKMPWDGWHAALGALVVVLGVTCVWLWSEVADEKSDSREAIAMNTQRGQRMVADAERAGQQAVSQANIEAAEQQAMAFATAIQPIMTFKGQVPEITDRSIQMATENLARQGNYSFVVVTDANGQVISSSDLTIMGQDFSGNLEPGVSTVEGQNQAVAPIGGDGMNMGHVVVRVRS